MKRYFMFLAAVVVAAHYCRPYIHADKLLEVARRHPQSEWSGAAAYYVGMYHFSRSQYPQAVAAFTQVLSRPATDQYCPPARFRLAQSYEAMMQLGSSIEELQNYMEDYPDDPDIPTVKRKLDLLRSQTGR